MFVTQSSRNFRLRDSRDNVAINVRLMFPLQSQSSKRRSVVICAKKNALQKGEKKINSVSKNASPKSQYIADDFGATGMNSKIIAEDGSIVNSPDTVPTKQVSITEQFKVGISSQFNAKNPVHLGVLTTVGAFLILTVWAVVKRRFFRKPTVLTPSPDDIWQEKLQETKDQMQTDFEVLLNEELAKKETEAKRQMTEVLSKRDANFSSQLASRELEVREELEREFEMQLDLETVKLKEENSSSQNDLETRLKQDYEDQKAQIEVEWMKQFEDKDHEAQEQISITEELEKDLEDVRASHEQMQVHEDQLEDQLKDYELMLLNLKESHATEMETTSNEYETQISKLAEEIRLQELEIERRRKAKEEKELARIEAEEKALAEAEEQARIEAEKKAKLEAEAKALEEEQARLEAEAKALEEAEEQARIEAEGRALAEAEEIARLDAEEKARIEAEARALVEQQIAEENQAQNESRRGQFIQGNGTTEHQPLSQNSIALDTRPVQPIPSTNGLVTKLPKPPARLENGTNEEVLLNAEIRMIAAGAMLPHMNKVLTGGEDAFFICSEGCGSMGVADGVGGWSSDGVDPSLYSKQLMDSALECLTELGDRADASLALEYAHEQTKAPGSATACLAVVTPAGILEVVNLGDCGVRVIRGSQCVFSTEAMCHDFNMPYQLGNPMILPETDWPSNADTYSFELIAGDLIIMGSDGLFDNLWNDDLARIANSFQKRLTDVESAEKLARKIAEVAHFNAKQKDVRSPWAVRAAEAGVTPLLHRMFPRGGKMDDCTVLVGFANLCE